MMNNCPSASIRLFLEVCDSCIDGLAAGVPFLQIVPMRDLFFTHLPAEQNCLTFDDAREVEQTHIEILYLNAGGVDFGYRILNALNGFVAFGAAAGGFADLNQQAAGKEYPLR